MTPTDAPAKGGENVIGFTGTQRGATEAQSETLLSALIGFREAGVLWMENGDCIGADDDAGRVWRILGGKVSLHPPTNDSKRAWMTAHRQANPKPYLDRNRGIVDASTVVVATPGEADEQPRGGTWYTIRYARKKGKPLMIITPDGKFTLERWPDGLAHPTGGNHGE
jgi:hypothetical protein